MLEVEVKYRQPDWTGVQRQLAAWGATQHDSRIEVDHYFNAPDRDFARTDEALRLRSIGPLNRFTYKGPRIDAATKTRKEVEVPLGEGPEAAALAVQFLLGLGYRSVAVISKTRQIYSLHREGFAAEVCLDDAGEVGRFVEVEIPSSEEQFPAARAALLALAQELGLNEVEPRSYLRLHLELRASLDHNSTLADSPPGE
jgi:adenylate cyclase class 2